ncbi:hypothetical protein FJY94_07940 [Candidatus Kaiserbacteria bacterium]|nr:hypothetical protein [Candidatus Kaiserbacteria bacterium]
MLSKCQKCGIPFERETGETWKKLCLDCWKASKKPTVQACTGGRDTGIEDRLRADLETWRSRAIRAEAALSLHRCPATTEQFNADELKTLRRLVHPDKHGNSEAATRLTQKLNAMLSG